MIKQTYENYKDSGIEWIGEIPSGWTNYMLKYIVDWSNAWDVIDKSFWWWGSNLTYTCSKMPVMTDYNSFDSSRRTTDHDLLLTRNWYWYIHISEVGSIYTNVVQRITLKKWIVDKKLLYYILMNQIPNIHAKSNGDFITSLNYEMRKYADIPLSSDITEQQAIASYLDEKTDVIDKLIQQKKHQIALLQEKHTALINQAVTRWLDPDVELVDSGIEWIGMIPKGWRLWKMSRTIDVRDWTHDTPQYVDSSVWIPFVTSKDLENGKVNFTDVKYIDPIVHQEIRKRSFVEKNDILMAMIGTIWNPCLVDVDFEFSIKNVALFKTNEFNHRLLYYYLLSDSFKNYLRINESWWIQKFIWLWDLRSTWLIIPNKIVQFKISDYLDKKTNDIGFWILKIQSSINLLTEYKQSLIAHVVTGKVKVI